MVHGNRKDFVEEWPFSSLMSTFLSGTRKTWFRGRGTERGSKGNLLLNKCFHGWAPQVLLQSVNSSVLSMDHASREQDNGTSKEQARGKENRGQDMGFISLNFIHVCSRRKILEAGGIIPHRMFWYTYVVGQLFERYLNSWQEGRSLKRILAGDDEEQD